jgi:hypothetical protein
MSDVKADPRPRKCPYFTNVTNVTTAFLFRGGIRSDLAVLLVNEFDVSTPRVSKIIAGAKSKLTK